MKTTFN